jgi:hypothetical protein
MKGGWQVEILCKNNRVLEYVDLNVITSMVPTGWRIPTHFFVGSNWLNASTG